MAIELQWSTLYAAGRHCHDLADRLSLAFGPLESVLVRECKGMAGDAPGCLQWAAEYDVIAADHFRAVAALVNALVKYGDVLNAFGWNYAVSQHPDHMPDKPTESELYYDTEMDMPASSAGNGPGVDRDGGDSGVYEKFLDKIQDELGGLPNGNIRLLDTAALAWNAFAHNNAVTEAAADIQTVIGLFDSISDPHKDTLLEQLGTLRGAATDVAASSLSISTAVSDYAAGTGEVRSAISGIVSTAVIGIAVTAAVGIVAAVFTFGAGAAAAGGGIATIIANTVNAVRTAYEGTKLIRILGLLGRLGRGAVGVIEAFNAAKNIKTVTGALATILALKVAIDSLDDDRTHAGPANSSNTPGTPDYQQRVEELAKDPAKNGKISPQSRREAEVGLANENAGRVGPLERAPLGPHGEDQGEFIDTETNLRWDVKSSPDVIPDYRPPQVAGNPISNPQSDQEFIDMVNDSIASGEGVMIDESGMTADRKARLQEIVANNPQWQGKVLW
ncbi:hypothetical protein [Nocardia aurantia]|uniref:Uncharacterized protein n=1 Tax=Nocardia aurantia TaxID=2585199 RepID=A0A7K0DLX3_9NOCA|nr:hypothetical protein [Nocardia aurantia]MQY26760.1 hypothetical protein [Nocardia aurantia]